MFQPSCELGIHDLDEHCADEDQLSDGKGQEVGWERESHLLVQCESFGKCEMSLFENDAWCPG